MPVKCDILIIGAGVLGVSAAYQLALRRAGRVILLERAFPGAGGSGQRVACIRRYEADMTLARMARDSLRAYERFGEIQSGPSVLHRTGLVLVASNDERDSLVATHDTLRKDLGVDIRPVSALDLLEIDPNSHLGDREIAFFDRESGVLDAVQIITSLTEAARRHGAEIRQGVEVQRLALTKGKITGVETNEGVYEFGSLVMAAGPWCSGLVRDLPTSPQLHAIRSPMALFRRPPDCARRSVIHADRVQGLLFQPAGGDLLLVAAANPQDTERDASTDPSADAVTADWLQSSRQRLCRRYPPLHRAYARGGYRALSVVTSTGRPWLDRLPGMENAWAVTGFGDRDVELAPLAGQVLTDLILSGTTELVDPAAFRPALPESVSDSPSATPRDKT